MAAVIPTAKVLVDGASGLEFDYELPAGMLGSIVIGSRVRIPLRNRPSTGTVVALGEVEEGTREAGYLKPVAAVIGDNPILTPKLIELGRWIGGYYRAPMEAVMRSLIPEAVRGENHDFQRRQFAKLSRPIDDDELATVAKRAPRLRIGGKLGDPIS